MFNLKCFLELNWSRNILAKKTKENDSLLRLLRNWKISLQQQLVYTLFGLLYVWEYASHFGSVLRLKYTYETYTHSQ